MKLSKRQRLFIVVIPIAAVVAICIHINALGSPTQSYSESPDVALLALVADNKQANTPEEIGRACLPPTDAAGAELIGEYQNPTSTQLFQIWTIYITPDHPVTRIHGLYINEEGTACLPAYDERYDKTIGDNLSEEDARQVALVFWQHIVDKVGGIEALQTNYDNEARELEQYGEQGYMPAESMWALEALGIQIPGVYQVYDPENPPQITDSTRGDI